jgi:ferritin-like metal-binding protein YciE
MRIKTMDELFVETLKDIYYAEKHIVKALPDMVKKAHGGELKKALENLRSETKEQINRLEKAFEMLDVSPRARKCEAIEGILRESEEDMAAIEDEDVRDAGMIGSAQAIEHYEICRYGTLIEWAKDLGRNDVAALLGQSLEQEKNADKLLTQIARSTTNRLAAGGAAA